MIPAPSCTLDAQLRSGAFGELSFEPDDLRPQLTVFSLRIHDLLGQDQHGSAQADNECGCQDWVPGLAGPRGPSAGARSGPEVCAANACRHSREQMTMAGS